MGYPYFWKHPYRKNRLLFHCYLVGSETIFYICSDRDVSVGRYDLS